ncbi:tryptophan 7-halogenase [Qipengyuania flava]|uniref:tryptophan 7-halogenase n=1 Tax=Qipengyuania flava TaxID=192812 RepID=UPI001C63AC42|nr:tryptophan 7-halogenase [Qipengyuania flava]QYJ05900.1 tryptophan 7-halogenase [Qipengyuania flava]
MSAGAAKSIVLVGAAEDVWPVAALLAPALRARAAVTVVEHGSAEEAVAVVPVADPYFALAGIAVSDLAKAGADFALGLALEGFAPDGRRIIVAPSGDLPMIGGLPFHHILRRVAEEAKALDRFAELYEGFRFCARAAKAGAMALPEDAPQSPLAMLGPLTAIERTALAQLLKSKSDLCSIDVLRCETVSLEEVAGSGQHKLTADGTPIGADLVIDLRARTKTGGDRNIPALSSGLQATAHYEAGVLPTYRAPDARSTGDAAAYANEAPWSGNLLRMGRASARLGPLFAADARLLLLQAQHLLETLPATPDFAAEARRFNQLHWRSVERLSEWVAVPTSLGAEAQQPVPEGLALRVEQFRSRGRMPSLDGDVLDRQTWIDLLLAFGVIPQRHDRRADAFDPRQLDHALGTVRGQLEQALKAMPDSARFRHRFASS